MLSNLIVTGINNSWLRYSLKWLEIKNKIKTRLNQDNRIDWSFEELGILQEPHGNFERCCLKFVELLQSNPSTSKVNPRVYTDYQGLRQSFQASIKTTQGRPNTCIDYSKWFEVIGSFELIINSFVDLGRMSKKTNPTLVKKFNWLNNFANKADYAELE